MGWGCLAQSYSLYNKVGLPRSTIPVRNKTNVRYSSNICKLSAVGLGWERAFGSVDDMGEMEKDTKGWVEIDNAGNIAPVWEAFQLFN